MSELIFENEKYIVKTFSMDNFENFCEINQDPIVAKYVNHNNGKPKTFSECVEKYSDMAHAQNANGYSYWAIYDKDNNFMGQCGALRTWLGENNFCYAFKKKYWGRGIGTEICSMVKNYLFDNFKIIDKLTCSAFSENVASVKLLKKIGFKVVRLDMEFDKELQFFELTREDYEKKNI